MDNEEQTLYSFNNLNNTWTEIGGLKIIFKNFGRVDSEYWITGGVRCKRGFNYFFQGFVELLVEDFLKFLFLKESEYGFMMVLN